MENRMIIVISLVLVAGCLAIMAFVLFSSTNIIHQNVDGSLGEFKQFSEGRRQSYFWFHSVSYYNRTFAEQFLDDRPHAADCANETACNTSYPARRDTDPDGIVGNGAIRADGMDDATGLDAGGYATGEQAAEADICTRQREEILIIRLGFNTSQVPMACDIFVDDRWVKEVDLAGYHCAGGCRKESIIENIDAESEDIRKEHVVKACCDQICIARIIKPLCK